MMKKMASIKLSILAFILLLSTSCGQQPKLPEVPGVKGPFFNVMDGKVLITLKLLNSNLNFGGKFPIPKTKDSSIEVSPNVEDGGSMIVFYVDLEDLESINIGVGDPNTLPDGRPLPGIPGGVLNSSIRADTELLDMSFYFNPKLFGIYLPIGWSTYGLAGYWNIVINEKNIGMLGAVASDEDGRSAGLLLFLKLDALKDRQLQKLIKLSKKNPHLMY